MLRNSSLAPQFLDLAQLLLLILAFKRRIIGFTFQQQVEEDMIKCKLIYRDKKGIASDTVRFDKELQVLPQVGDSIVFAGQEANFTVIDVAHILSKESNAHEIWIYYQAR